MKLIFHPDTAKEIKSTFDWYQEKSDGLGHDFIYELEEAFDSIVSLPSAWPKIDNNHRRFGLSRFPYSVIYKQHNNHLHIVAVMHNHQKPGYWSERN